MPQAILVTGVLIPELNIYANRNGKYFRLLKLWGNQKEGGVSMEPMLHADRNLVLNVHDLNVSLKDQPIELINSTTTRSNQCPKINFHESGSVAFSKTGRVKRWGVIKCPTYSEYEGHLFSILLKGELSLFKEESQGEFMQNSKLGASFNFDKVDLSKEVKILVSIHHPDRVGISKDDVPHTLAFGLQSTPNKVVLITIYYEENALNEAPANSILIMGPFTKTDPDTRKIKFLSMTNIINNQTVYEQLKTIDIVGKEVK